MKDSPIAVMVRYMSNKKDIPKEKAIELYKKGLSLNQVAFNLGIHASTIRNRFKEWGVKTRIGRGNKFWNSFKKRI